MKKKIIEQMLEEEILSYTDIHFAALMEKLDRQNDSLFLAASLASSQARYGNICLDLDDVAGKSLLLHEDFLDIKCPDKKDWIEYLKTCSVIGSFDEYKPLILEDDKRLYLYRYWEYQKKLADFVIKSSKEKDDFQNYDLACLKTSLNRLFPESFENQINKVNKIDWQKVAACISVLKKFSVISGGPGTGKTTTVTKILALLLEQWTVKNKSEDIRICLGAPTGKAAARLSESIIKARMTIDCSDEIRSRIPDKASTIHRLLGSINNSPYFRYNSKRKLPVDLVVIDEASMVDLALMSKLVQALPDNARLILLGDQDQLASVAAGAVLGDICNTGVLKRYSDEFINTIYKITDIKIKPSDESTDSKGMSDCIAILHKSYRFGETSGIRAASHAVNSGDDKLFYKIAANKQYPDVVTGDLPFEQVFMKTLEKYVLKYFVPVFNEKNIEEKINLFEKFRILCAVRKGKYGLENLNLLIEKILIKTGYIKSETKWYPGRPVMITQNDYQTGLFNGDIGITISLDDKKNALEVWFIKSDGNFVKFKPENLPFCETVYAMTVHKSQGSEFDCVLFIMPDYDTPVITRELIYTGITRARSFIEIRGEEKIVRKAIQRKTIRKTGLRQMFYVNNQSLKELI